MIRIVLSCLVLSATALVAFPREAAACRCMLPGPVPDAVQKSDAVFVGKVVHNMRGANELRSTFLVERRFKGVGARIVSVFTASQPSACGVAFARGRSYLVYAWKSGAALSTSTCTRTKPLETAADDLRILASLAGGEGAACGSRGMAPCATGLRCVFPESARCGASDLPGRCVKVGPRMCYRIYRPVCGCDGRTYSNDCVALSAGASIAYQGACRGQEGAACGSRGMAPCAEGLKCVYPDQARCGATDIPGACTRVVPRPCARDYRPVCGCDGRTYSNRCVAGSSGASVAHDGQCRSSGGGGTDTGTPCGVRGTPPCAPGLKCVFPEAARCGAADHPGKCTRVEQRICPMIYDPVCGCDGRTYSNTCVAAGAGASIAYRGACRQ